jgi:hypothetical protein
MTLSTVYIVLAEIVWLIHSGYVAFVVGGQILILGGAAAGWPWIRNLAFRLAHLTAIGVVAFETLIDVPCTLTVLQDYLLVQGGLRARGFDINPFSVPRGFWDATYLVFAGIVLVTFLLVPPRVSRTAQADVEPA